jgi:hypothetical protein
MRRLELLQALVGFFDLLFAEPFRVKRCCVCHFLFLLVFGFVVR